MIRPRVSLREALNDKRLLGSVLAGDSWKAWRTLLIAALGEQLRHPERELFKELTGRAKEPLAPVEEFVGVIGRRGGKSRAISVLASYIAGLCEHPSLVVGERGVLLIISVDQRQSAVIFNYIVANLEASPILSQLVESTTQSSLRLTNGIDIEVRASNFRTLRGPSYVAVIVDEVAFLMSDEGSANPDEAILNAVRPGLATTGGPMILISSPYARRGELWKTYQRHFGPKGDPLVLVAQGESRAFNPSLKQSVVDRAYERDAASASAEFGAQFRSDLEEFVSQDVVRSCQVGTTEIPPVRGVTYSAFVDPSGGSSDSMTLAIAHYDKVRTTVVLDAIRERSTTIQPRTSRERIHRHPPPVPRQQGHRRSLRRPVAGGTVPAI